MAPIIFDCGGMNVRRGLPVTSFGVDPPREKHDGSAPPSFFSPGLLILYAEKSGYEMHQVDKHRVHASFRIAPNERLLYIVRLLKFHKGVRLHGSKLGASLHTHLVALFYPFI